MWGGLARRSSGTPAATALAGQIRAKHRHKSAAPASVSRGESSPAASWAWARPLGLWSRRLRNFTEDERFPSNFVYGQECHIRSILYRYCVVHYVRSQSFAHWSIQAECLRNTEAPPCNPFLAISSGMLVSSRGACTIDNSAA